MSRSLSIPAHLRIAPKWGPIGEQVFKRTYSHDKEDGTKEDWFDAVTRCVNGNINLVDPKFIEPGEQDKLFGLLYFMEALPAGRHLSSSGRVGRQFLFNCHASGWDKNEPSAHFTFLFDQLMQGGGVGSNYSNRYLESLPVVSRQIDAHIICRADHPDLDGKLPWPLEGVNSDLLSTPDGDERLDQVFVVPDDREGWVKAVEIVTRMAFGENAGFRGNPDKANATIVFDVSRIRVSGTPLKTSGGIACGPGPLMVMLTNYVRQLNACYGRQLTSIDAMTLDHALASCVIAGGKRRSSRMAVKSWADTDIFDFINCKGQDGLHWTTNISVEVDDAFYDAYLTDDGHARRVMRAVTLGKRSNGEPGLWNRSYAQVGEREPELMYCPNPCGEIGLQMWENCNLGHINMEAFAPRPDGSQPSVSMSEAFRLMTRWLVRATFGDIPQPRQREVVDRNRRIGVGFFGYHSWLALHGIKYSDSHKDAWVQSVLTKAQELVRATAAAYAEQLNIPCPVKNTTLAPTGTTAALTGSTTGAQCMIAPWFKRLVRYSTMDPELAIKKLEGYEIIPDDDAHNTDIVVYWCEDPLVTKVRAMGYDPAELLESQYDISLRDSLSVQAMLQDVYTDNAISFTINMRPEDMPGEEEMESMFMEFLPRIKGTTFFPEKSRKNSPIQPLTKEEFDAYQGRKEITMIEDVCRGGCPVK